jgi:transcription initiation factor TFIIH subunit 2
LDLSELMADPTTSDHLRPTKLEAAGHLLTDSFIPEFFDVNPLGSLGIGAMRDGLAERVVEMSGGGGGHQEVLRRRENRECKGEASLQNAMELARMSLM